MQQDNQIPKLMIEFYQGIMNLKVKNLRQFLSHACTSKKEILIEQDLKRLFEFTIPTIDQKGLNEALNYLKNYFTQGGIRVEDLQNIILQIHFHQAKQQQIAIKKQEEEQKQQDKRKQLEQKYQDEEKLQEQILRSLLQDKISEWQELQVQPILLFEIMNQNNDGYLQYEQFYELMTQILEREMQNGNQDLENIIKKIFDQKNKQNNGQGFSKLDFQGLIQQMSEINIQLPSYQNKQNKKQEQVEVIEDDPQIIKSEILDNEGLKDYMNLDQQKLEIEQDFQFNQGESLIVQPQEQINKELKLKKQQSSSEIFHKLEGQLMESINDRNDISKLPFYDEFIFAYFQTQNSDELFVDPQFSPQQNHIGKDPKFKKIKWARLTAPNVKIFQKGKDFQSLQSYISPEDIIQGSLGDCYFLSAISSLAFQNPKKIFDLFLTIKPNPKGIYGVKICLNGQWQIVILDDYFPVIQYHQNICLPAFTKSNGNELWVLLLEKAWAKVSGSYENIERGVCSDAMRVLTGAPTMQLETSDKNFWDDFEHLMQIQAIMTAVSTSEAHLKEQFMKKLGLTTQHAYSILGKIEIFNEQRGMVTLIKLRNPWGKLEWKGEWSSDSPLWTQEQRQQYLYNQVGHGIFYMDIDNFIQYFPLIEVCLLKDRNKSSSIMCNTKRSSAQYIGFHIEESGEYYFSITQPDKRTFYGSTGFNHKEAQRLEQLYKKSPAILVLARVQSKSELKMIGAKRQLNEYVFYGGYLSKGDYIGYCKVNWQWTDQYSFVVGLYGPEEVKLYKINKVDEYLENVYMDRARKEQKKIVNIRGYKIDQRVQFIMKEGFGFIYQKNLS